MCVVFLHFFKPKTKNAKKCKKRLKKPNFINNTCNYIQNYNYDCCYVFVIAKIGVLSFEKPQTPCFGRKVAAMGRREGVGDGAQGRGRGRNWRLSARVGVVQVFVQRRSVVRPQSVFFGRRRERGVLWFFRVLFLSGFPLLGFLGFRP